MTIITSYLMVIHIGARPVWLVRAGQCTDDVVRAVLKENAARAGGGGGGVEVLQAPMVGGVRLEAASASTVPSTALSAGAWRWRGRGIEERVVGRAVDYTLTEWESLCVCRRGLRRVRFCTGPLAHHPLRPSPLPLPLPHFLQLYLPPQA